MHQTKEYLPLIQHSLAFAAEPGRRESAPGRGDAENEETSVSSSTSFIKDNHALPYHVHFHCIYIFRLQQNTSAENARAASIAKKMRDKYGK